MQDHEEAKKLKNSLELLTIKITYLVEQKAALQDRLYAICPHKYRREWDDYSGNIWSQCSLCEQDVKIIGKVEMKEDRVYYAERERTEDS